MEGGGGGGACAGGHCWWYGWIPVPAMLVGGGGAR